MKNRKLYASICVSRLLQRASRKQYSQLDNDKGSQKFYKSTEEVWAGRVPIGHVESDQHIPERVPHAPGVVVVSQQTSGRKVSDKDCKVEECGHELQYVAEEKDGHDGEERDRNREDRL